MKLKHRIKLWWLKYKTNALADKLGIELAWADSHRKYVAALDQEYVEALRDLNEYRWGLNERGMNERSGLQNQS